MKTLKTPSLLTGTLFFSIICISSSCLTGAKMDKYLARQYNNELPRPVKKKNADITITTTVPSTAATDISNSNHKTSKMLPLLLYWQWEYKVSSELNPAIGLARFSNAISSTANKDLAEKLKGQKLELKIEQLPSSFAIVDKAHTIYLLLAAYTWEKVYVSPDTKDLVVSYKILQNDTTVKVGKISVKNNAHNNNLRYFQSWKSATREHLTDYDSNVAQMTRTFVDRLLEEL